MDCRIEGCTGRHYGKGLCQAHYRRQKTGSPMDAPLNRRWTGSPVKKLSGAEEVPLHVQLAWAKALLRANGYSVKMRG